MGSGPRVPTGGNCNVYGVFASSISTAGTIEENKPLQEVFRGWSITTNLAFKQWGTVFPGAACVAALVDRFAQHLHTVDIDAESWRQNKNEPPPKSEKRKPKR